MDDPEIGELLLMPKGFFTHSFAQNVVIPKHFLSSYQFQFVWMGIHHMGPTWLMINNTFLEATVQIVHQSMLYPTISKTSTAQNSSRYDLEFNTHTHTR